MLLAYDVVPPRFRVDNPFNSTKHWRIIKSNTCSLYPIIIYYINIKKILMYMQCNSRTHINKWYQLQPATNRWKENSQTHFAWTCHFWRSAWCPNVAQAWLATAWRGWRPSQVQHNGQQREAETCFVLLFQWEESSFAKSFNAGVSGRSSI